MRGIIASGNFFMGLDIYLGHCLKEEDPEEMEDFNEIEGYYLRSSYNSGGFNAVMGNIVKGSHGFYDIFKPGNEYIVYADWEQSIVRAEELKAKLLAETLQLITFHAKPLYGVNLLEKFKEKQEEVLAQPNPFFDSFWQNGIEYFINGYELKVYAIAYQNNHIEMVIEAPKEEMEYLVGRIDHAIEFCRAAIQYEIDHPDEKCFLYWSG